MKSKDETKTPEIIGEVQAEVNPVDSERVRLNYLKEKIARTVGKLQSELVIGDARFKLRKELADLIEEI